MGPARPSITSVQPGSLWGLIAVSGEGGAAPQRAAQTLPHTYKYHLCKGLAVPTGICFRGFTHLFLMKRGSFSLWGTSR